MQLLSAARRTSSRSAITTASSSTELKNISVNVNGVFFCRSRNFNALKYAILQAQPRNSVPGWY